jgi:hypothetical protein
MSSVIIDAIAALREERDKLDGLIGQLEQHAGIKSANITTVIKPKSGPKAGRPPIDDDPVQAAKAAKQRAWRAKKAAATVPAVPVEQPKPPPDESKRAIWRERRRQWRQRQKQKKAEAQASTPVRGRTGANTKITTLIGCGRPGE